MRTAEVCPTCAKYTNALCVLYDGEYLAYLGIEPGDSMEVVLGKINDWLAANVSTTSTTSTSTTSTSSTTTTSTTTEFSN